MVVVGLSYFILDPPAELWNNPARGRIARYAWGLDYHDIMLPRLRELGNFINKETGQIHNQRSYVDTGPVLEREFAAQAGLGFVGKNTLLINPKMGSYLFLGEILIDKTLDYDEPALEGGASCAVAPPGESKRVGTCGNCTRCLEICPTHAFPTPYILDSNRCISYLTIEHKEIIPETVRPLMGNWIYGCDECQEICPWVRRYAPRKPTRETFLRYDPEWVAPKLVDLLAMDDTAFRARFKGTPIKRTRRHRFFTQCSHCFGQLGQPRCVARPAPRPARPRPAHQRTRRLGYWTD